MTKPDRRHRARYTEPKPFIAPRTCQSPRWNALPFCAAAALSLALGAGCMGVVGDDETSLLDADSDITAGADVLPNMGGGIDCSGIEQHPTFELCDRGDDFCAGVFTGGEGCSAYCASAGLICIGRLGGEPGC